MEVDVIKSLKLKLSDLTYILFVISKEFELIIQHSDDEKVNNELRQVISNLQDSNNNVIKLFHEINNHTDAMQNEWYNDEQSIKDLQKEVDNLSKSIDIMIEGNRKFLNINK